MDALPCNYCLREDDGLKRCAGCSSVWYCSRSCQSLDWPDHKKVCQKQSSKESKHVVNEKHKFDLHTSRNVERSTKSNITREDVRGMHHPNTDDKSSGENEHDKHDAEEQEGWTKRQNNSCKEKNEDKTLTDNELYGRHVKSSMEKEYRELANNDTSENNGQGDFIGIYSDSGADERVDSAKEANIEPNFDEIDEIDDVTIPKDEAASNLKSETNGNETVLGRGNKCNWCKVPGCLKSCARCKETFYCSKTCQRRDWVIHKQICKKKYTEEESRIIEEKQREKKDARKRLGLDKSEGKWVFTFNQNYAGGSERFCQMLTPEQALVNEIRPPGSLEKAVRFAKVHYPFYNVITRFRDMPMEPMFPFQMFMQRMEPSVLVAFMFSYHEHVMRHGVYLKDAVDTETRVEFYLDHVGDNPFPFFHYSQVKPGNYILIEDPVWHIFMDGTIGIRVNDPSDVCILDKQKVM